MQEVYLCLTQKQILFSLDIQKNLKKSFILSKITIILLVFKLQVLSSEEPSKLINE